MLSDTPRRIPAMPSWIRIVRDAEARADGSTPSERRAWAAGHRDAERLGLVGTVASPRCRGSAEEFR